MHVSSYPRQRSQACAEHCHGDPGSTMASCSAKQHRGKHGAEKSADGPSTIEPAVSNSPGLEHVVTEGCSDDSLSKHGAQEKSPRDPGEQHARMTPYINDSFMHLVEEAPELSVIAMHAGRLGGTMLSFADEQIADE